jgi:hypothetical protein
VVLAGAVETVATASVELPRPAAMAATQGKVVMAAKAAPS